MNTILVTATEESSGKTAVALGLALHARERGLSVGYMKPKGTRLGSVEGRTLDEDPLLAAELLDIEADVADLEPIVYSGTFVEEAIRRRGDTAAHRESVRESFDRLAADRDLMVVEGGGRLTTGGVVDLTDPEVAALLDAEVVLVEGYDGPGDVDDVLAAVELIGDRLRGVVANRVTESAFDAFETEVVPFLEARDIPVPGVIPRETELAGVTVADLADELGAEVLTDVPTGAFLERFVVGAMSADSALSHFRRTKDAAVVTGGDRAEIQTVALEAPSVRCLVLTGGTRPSSAVLGRAQDRGVPVLLVGSDTLATIERMEDVIREGRTRDERTVTRMKDLLSAHADVDELLGDVGEE